MNRLLTVILLLALSCSLFSCGDDDPVSSGKPRYSAEDFYPTAVGLLWTYEIRDAISGERDTVIVSVTDRVVMDDGETRFEWKYNFGDSVLVNAVSLVDSSLRIYDRYGDTIPSEHFILPPEIGKTWPGTGIFSDDTSIVVDSATVTMEAGVFSSTYRIDREWGRDFEGGSFQRSTFLCPRVGMVFRRDVETRTDGGGPADTVSHVVWRLIGYNTYTFALEQFPNKEGTQWVYEFFDSLLNEYDTVTVTIADTLPVDSGEPMRLWTYHFSDSVDTQYVVTADNWIGFFSDTLYQIINVAYQFPLAVGRSWGIYTSQIIPIPDVIEKDTIIVPAGSFGGGFHHEWFEVWIPNDYRTINTWLVPEVGIVQQTRHDFGLGLNRYIRWKLLSYNIVR